MKKIASIVGARPNFVKLAPVSRALREEFREIIVHTGQHYDYEMDRIFFEEMGIAEPGYHLGVGSGSHGRQTGEMLSKIEEVLLRERPDAVVVFGDTNTTLAGALAAAKLHMPVMHVEAGLRSFDRRMPEEVNRVLVDHCSDMLSCPTSTAVENLKDEGIIKGVSLTGDVMVDAMADCRSIAFRQSGILEELGFEPRRYILATVHRAENTDDPRRLAAIVEALIEIEDIVIFPCHPRTERRLRDAGLWERLCEASSVIKPVGYLDMIVLEGNAAKILTDSGGVQKEAYILKVPCITMRDTTEWVETVEDGWNILVGSDRDRIVAAAKSFRPAGEQSHAYGDGRASIRIRDMINEFINKGAVGQTL